MKKKWGDSAIPAMHLPAGSIGMVCALEFAMEFRKWADAQHALTADAIKARWQVSRATSYRWLSAYRNVVSREAA